MAGTRTAAWVGGAAVVAIVIAGGAWFGVVAPTLSDAEEQRRAAADQREHNDMLQIALNQLKADAANLETDKANLAALRTRIPTTGDLAELTRQLQSAATATGVTITVLAPGTPTPVVVATPEAPAPADGSEEDAGNGDGTDSSVASAEVDGTADDGSTPPAGASTGIDGLVSIPLSVTTVGTYAQTIAFIEAVQQTMTRLFVVSQLTAVSLEEEGAAGGRPATSFGDLETTLTGVVLTLRDGTGATSTPSGETSTGEPTPTPSAPVQLPVPGDQRNPFAPVP